jgi:Nif-specific regulatory protein
MPSIRSILWVGPGERFSAELAKDAPSLDVVWAPDAEAALEITPATFDALVLDLAPGETESGAALAALRRRCSGRPILVRIDPQDRAERARLLAAGATDVWERATPDGDAQDGRRLRERIEALMRRRAAPSRPGARGRRLTRSAIVGDSAPMRAVFELVLHASQSRATVLISGETGTGKELIARAIHDEGPRRGASFVAVNCAAFPDTLLESELFGHVRGAFTGADRDRKGLFEVADGGTLFLDEIGETSRPFQAKLLRVLQERELRPVGGTRSRRMDVRVIAATNRDLRAGAAAGFREDLYYRLAVFPIHAPPLRERTDDVLPLALHFLAHHGAREDVAGVSLSDEAGNLLCAHSWPGNVRELENEIQRALALSEPGATLGPEQFSENLFGDVDATDAHVVPGETLRETMDRIEARLVRRALDQNDGRRTRTARKLGLTREGLYKKMKRLNVE